MEDEGATGGRGSRRCRRLRGRGDARRREASTIREGTRPSARRAFFPLGGTKVETPRGWRYADDRAGSAGSGALPA